MPTLSIRRGTPRDVPVIVRLIRGLAEYERLAHEMVATTSQIRRHGFGRRRYFETLICRRGRAPVGFALYFFTYSTFLGRPSLYLEDLFVLPEERGRGAGRALLGELARIAKRRGWRPHGVGRSRLEHALDQVLSEARREASPAVDPDATDRRAAQPAGASGCVAIPACGLSLDWRRRAPR